VGAYIKEEGCQERIGSRLMAAVLETKDGKKRFFFDSESVTSTIEVNAVPNWKPRTALPDDTRNFWIVNYGFDNYGKLFTDRQLVALNTFSDLIKEVKKEIISDLRESRSLETLDHATSYANAVVTYLACGVDRAADYWSSNATWESGGGFIAHVFTKQAIPMVWDFAESNPFSTSTGNWLQTCIAWIVRVINTSLPATVQGSSQQSDASTQSISELKIVSTDPPYYDNISYADLSDFFYPWMRKSLKEIYPDLFTTIAVPKVAELIARHHGFPLKGITHHP